VILFSKNFRKFLPLFQVIYRITANWLIESKVILIANKEFKKKLWETKVSDDGKRA
jgi:hypothetical protein